MFRSDREDSEGHRHPARHAAAELPPIYSVPIDASSLADLAITDPDTTLADRHQIQQDKEAARDQKWAPTHDGRPKPRPTGFA